MKESRPANTPKHRARRGAPTTPDITCKQEREEIAQIAMMLTDKRKIYYLLGTARGLLKMEIEQNPNIT